MYSESNPRRRLIRGVRPTKTSSCHATGATTDGAIAPHGVKHQTVELLRGVWAGSIGTLKLTSCHYRQQGWQSFSATMRRRMAAGLFPMLVGRMILGEQERPSSAG